MRKNANLTANYPFYFGIAGEFADKAGPLPLPLWLLGRLTCLLSAALPVMLAVLLDLSFSVMLTVVVAKEVLAARNLRNLLLLEPLVMLGVANVCMHLEAAGVASTGPGVRLRPLVGVTDLGVLHLSLAAAASPSTPCQRARAGPHERTTPE